MYVAVQHTVHDPASFFATAASATLPDGLVLHHSFPTSDGSRAICIWEAPSIDVLRDFLEPAIGPHSTNEYFVVENKSGIAAPSALQPA